MLSEGMFIEDWRARMGDSVALTTATVTEYLRRRDAESLRAQADAGPVAKTLPLEVLDVLRFYAHGHHFGLSDDTAWDTVSGEPQNFWCDEAGTATVEDGSIAKALLQGKAMEAEELCAPIDGEVYVAQEACNTHPSLPAAQGLSEDDKTALTNALEWIGKQATTQAGFARMQAARRSIETILSRAATVAEPSKCDGTAGTCQNECSSSCQPQAAQQQAEPVGDEEVQRVLNRLNSSDPEFDDCADAAALITRMAAEMKGPDGFATWKDAALAERRSRVANQAGDEDLLDMVSLALRRAWNLGQTYWQQADSEYTSQHRESWETQQKFEHLVTDTRTAMGNATQSGQRAGMAEEK
ncbi:MAG: hypothetical protein I4O48_17660 [Ralstonia sp.]|nr:hypothetical protein [Ralstonia sp.]